MVACGRPGRVRNLTVAGRSSPRPLGGKKIALRGEGGVTRKPIFPTPPPSLLGRCDGRGGFRAGAPDLPCRGGGGSTQHLWLKMIPTSR